MATEFAEVVQTTALELFPEPEWVAAKNQFEEIGINTEYYDMRCTVFETAYDRYPHLFERYQWINDENGMPLWVRPGVDWVPDYELEDNYDEFDINDY